MKIVYCSNAGHTKEYAQMLAAKLNIEAISLKDYKKSDEDIIFLGWIFASHVSGYNKLKGRKIKCVIGVGMTKPSEKNNEDIITNTQISEKFFYLRGGVDVNRLKGIKKLMLKMVAKSTSNNEAMGEDSLEVMISESKNFVDEDNLMPIINYVKGI